MAKITLADIALANGSDRVVGLIKTLLDRTGQALR